MSAAKSGGNMIMNESNDDKCVNLRLSETVLIQDDTPLEGFIDFVQKLTSNGEKKLDDSLTVSETTTVPFYVIFPLYLLISLFVWVIGQLFDTFLNKVSCNNTPESFFILSMFSYLLRVTSTLHFTIGLSSVILSFESCSTTLPSTRGMLHCNVPKTTI
jgi:hypothetical protein